MSSTTVMELTDTQMLDYSIDSDYTMHATGHSVEWLPVEATMSDDQILSATEYSETIEVDMDQNEEDEEMTEYEMADGTDYVNEDVVEIQDVDFADPSQVASPLGVSALGSPALVDAASFQLPPSPSLPLVSPALRSEAYVFHAAAPSIPERSTSSSDTPAHSTIPEPLEALHEPVPHPHAYLADDRSNGGEEPHVAQRPASPVEPGPANPLANLEAEPQTHSLDHAAVGAQVADSSDDAVGSGGQEDGSLQLEESFPDDAHAFGEVAELGAGQEVHENASNGDPHEISDGVYIEPPPAVLLSLSTSSQRVECCMFNQPHADSRAQSPSAHASSSTTPDLALLLSQRPTLYYEPLSNVFEALRQDETINSLSELVDGEMIIEAYDLDLRITEDNIHTGEVTIHELNILHDGIDLTGPLRLRLSAVPRFITRYHALRDQVAQLSLEAGLDNAPHPPANATDSAEVYETTDHRDTFSTSDRALDFESSEAARHETADDASTEPTQTGNTEHESLAQHPSNEPSHADPGQELQSASAEDQYDEQEHEDPADDAAPEAAEDQTTEYGTALTTGEPVEGLDADVHRERDAEEGGDYTDYAQHNPDDEEEFGEALPELGDGPAVSEGDDGHHETLAVPYGDVSTADGAAEAAYTEAEAEAQTALDTADSDQTSVGNVTNIAEEDVTETDGPADDYTKPEAVDRPSANDISRTESGETDNLEDYDAEGDLEDEGDPAEFQEELEDWGEFDDEDPEQSHYVPEDGSSKGSSETLSTLSKRSREEDEDEGDDIDGNPPHSPDSKRVRVE
ncbi:hypothetical protein PsYK624_030550 [Phanerochaete sordida]|uniref:Uncharacterized protein n=1 Tax=Phanerochaete sordida TaxID=48140 RepID=A0A9P3G2M1_9APHY|nr:hypothetical protein PsYK624_030550 [Phanerochaete sordida]